MRGNNKQTNKQTTSSKQGVSNNARTVTTCVVGNCDGNTHSVALFLCVCNAFLFPLGVCPSSLRYNLRSLRLVISQSDRRFCHLAFRAWAAEVQMSKKRNKIYQLSLKKKQHKSKEKEPQQDDQVRHQGTC